MKDTKLTNKAKKSDKNNKPTDPAKAKPKAITKPKRDPKKNQLALIDAPDPKIGQFTRAKRFCLDTWAKHCKEQNIDPSSIRFSREAMQGFRAVNEKLLIKAFQKVATLCRMMNKQTFGLKEANISIILENELTNPDCFLVEPSEKAQQICKDIMANIKYAHNKTQDAPIDSADILEFKNAFQVLFADKFECAAQLDKIIKLAEN